MRTKQNHQWQTGEIGETKTGRKTTPFPKIDLSSNRKAINTLKRKNKWLMENALTEATKRGDRLARIMFLANLNDPQQADLDLANDYLFEL